MQVNGQPYRSIWDEDGKVMIIDQTLLPFRFKTIKLKTFADAAEAIRSMKVRGAPLIGGTAAYAIYLSMKERKGVFSEEDVAELASTRPTAVNLHHAIDFMSDRVAEAEEGKDLIKIALDVARIYCDTEASNCLAIGLAGLPILEEMFRIKGETINILTHCNAGWVACIDYGTATSPIYMAHDKGIPVHVWVDETRPRNQGARLTAWELKEQGIPHTIIADNAGGHLMQQGLVDMVITGSDRTTRRGDVANKIGTYLKALAAKEHDIPFWVALPTSTIDMNIQDGMKEIPIEERDASEVLSIDGWDGNEIRSLQIAPEGSPAFNPGFDVTPAPYVSGLITERGLCKADEEDILRIMNHG